MAWTFNPFSGTFDQKASGGGGSSYLEGEVQNFSALPTSTPPAVDAAYLVREAEGTWLLNRKPAGIYIRVATTGTRATDWTYAGEFPDVFSDANFLLYDESDSTKNLKFQLSGITTGTTRTLTAPDASGTIALTSDLTSGVSAVGASADDVLSVSGSDLVADDGGTIDSADPFIKWDDTNSKLVYANPLSRPDGSFYIGSPPTTTPLGTDCLNIQTGRSNATYLAKDAQSTCIGYSARSTASTATAVGYNSTCGNGAAAYGHSSTAGNDSAAFGFGANASSGGSVAIGRSPSTTFRSIAIGYLASSTGQWAVAIGGQTGSALRAQFATRPFSSVFWSGTTTDATPTSLNLDGIATNKFNVAANRALWVDISLVARRSDTQDKWLVARRFLGIRRDGSNNTSLIGSVQTIGTDQSDGSPTWTFSLTADDVGDNLELEVTGAAGETVEWTATAFTRSA